MTLSANEWFHRLAPYKKSDDRRAIFELTVSILPYFALWASLWALLKVGQNWALIGVLPLGALLIRIFIIQHDCGHQAMFSERRANDWIGRFLAVLTLTPYDHWKRNHALHHAGSGNLDRRGMGDDILTLTVEEYAKLSLWGRLKYRMYRHPLVMFGIGPAYVFYISNRLPLGAMSIGISPWASTLLTNFGLIVIYSLMIWAVGWELFLLIQVPSTLIAASIGVWLFYVQHQFDETHWAKTGEWDRAHAALNGSSFYDLPKPLMWLTGNIGVHHVHHLSARIPFYNLPRVLTAYPELKQVGRLSLWSSFKCVKLVLWCEQTKQLVSFRAARMRYNPLSAVG